MCNGVGIKAVAGKKKRGYFCTAPSRDVSSAKQEEGCGKKEGCEMYRVVPCRLITSLTAGNAAPALQKYGDGPLVLL